MRLLGGLGGHDGLVSSEARSIRYGIGAKAQDRRV